MSGFDPAIFKTLKELDVKRDVPMSTLTSFRIGGPARAYIAPRNAAELLQALAAAEALDTDCCVIGNGTNLLVSDKGINALVIHISELFSGIERRTENVYYVHAGTLLSTFAKETVNAGLMGLEWAAGIPGSVGGAVAMNAGAYGGEIKQALTRINYVYNGKLCSSVPTDSELGYRKSVYTSPERVNVGAEFTLSRDDGCAKARMSEYNNRRKTKQPLNYPSAGSVFKRPEGHFAGALIEQAGLKGLSINGAKVSELHSGFIINAGGATCADVLSLIREIQRRVLNDSGVWLTPEIKVLGEFTDCEV